MRLREIEMPLINIPHFMKNLSFRTISYLILMIILSISFYLIRPFAFFPFFFVLMIFAIGISLIWFLKIFDIIEDNSSLKYWEIKQDHDSHKKIKKVSNSLYSYCSLLFSNFLISGISIFLLYTFKNDTAFLILASTTVVISIRLLAYINGEIAREVGKGFRYAILPLGFSLFLWDFFSSLIKNDPLNPSYAIYTFIINKVPIILVLICALSLITSFEPLFDLLVIKLNRYFKS